MQTFDWWVDQCRELLVGNQVTNGRYRYTRPAPHVYEYQWLWDSCFHAITYRWFDLEMARDELLSMVAKQVETGADTGMIPHMNYWQPDGMGLWGQAERSIITQPPLLAVAAEHVYAWSGDKQFLRQMYDAVAQYHAWFDRRRDPEGEHHVPAEQVAAPHQVRVAEELGGRGQLQEAEGSVGRHRIDASTLHLIAHRLVDHVLGRRWGGDRCSASGSDGGAANVAHGVRNRRPECRCDDLPP